MSDDVMRAAAERCFGGPSGYRLIGVSESLRCHPDLMRDLKAVARAYLAEHTWTKESPAEAGWHWHRLSRRGEGVVYVNSALNVSLGFTGRNEQFVSAADLGGEWAGPIRPPA